MKDAYYFPHDSNAQHDQKILQLRAKYGWAGYGLFWAIVERLRDTKDYKLGLSDDMIRGLSLGLSHPQAELKALLEDCFDLGLLAKKGDFFFSPSLLKRMDEVDTRREILREAGRRGGLASSQAKAKLKPPSSSKGKESKVNKRKGNKIKSVSTAIAGATVSDQDWIESIKSNPAYSHVDISNELSKIDAWLSVHPNRKKTRKFIVGWLNRIEKPIPAENKINGISSRTQAKIQKIMEFTP